VRALRRAPVLDRPAPDGPGQGARPEEEPVLRARRRRALPRRARRRGRRPHRRDRERRAPEEVRRRQRLLRLLRDRRGLRRGRGAPRRRRRLAPRARPHRRARPDEPLDERHLRPLVEGFDREPSILMPYNPPYYVDFLERYGFERAMTMWAYYVHEAYV